jgi:vacuolar-type H+-ATPase subunit D/Vma8
MACAQAFNKNSKMRLPSWKTKLPSPPAAAKTLFGDERNVLMARIIALLEENNQLLQELATARQERAALERALNALERHQKRARFDFTFALPTKDESS